MRPREEPQTGAGPGGRDPYRILVDSLDALVASGAVRQEARAGAEIAAWASVHGLASLLVEGPVQLSKAERSQAMRFIARTLLGLGCDPDVVGPRALPVETDPRLRGSSDRKS